jgi:hypothetical protein
LWRRPRPKLGCGAKERRRRRMPTLFAMRSFLFLAEIETHIELTLIVRLFVKLLAKTGTIQNEKLHIATLVHV